MGPQSNKNNEALYIIIFRNNNATALFKKWLSTSQHNKARVDANRLLILDQNTFNFFIVSWQHKWEDLTVWDCWAKRHIYL